MEHVVNQLVKANAVATMAVVDFAKMIVAIWDYNVTQLGVAFVLITAVVKPARLWAKLAVALTMVAKQETR